MASEVAQRDEAMARSRAAVLLDRAADSSRRDVLGRLPRHLLAQAVCDADTSGLHERLLESELNAQAEALARVRSDADRLVAEATTQAAEKVTAAISQKQLAAREGDARMRRETAARTRVEGQYKETAEALAKTEAMLAASTEALDQARKEATTLRLHPPMGAALAVDGATPFPEGTPFDSSWMSAAEPEGSGHQRLAAVATPQPVADSDGGNANFV